MTISIVRDTSIADALSEALAILRKRGWTQCVWIDEQGRVCADGAIGLATTGDACPEDAHGDPFTQDEWQLLQETREALRRAIAGTGFAVMTWNDRPERTQAEVEAAFEDAIRQAGGAS